MPVEASWTTSDGAAVKHIAETLLVSRNGGVLRLDEKLTAGQEITLRRMEGDLVKNDAGARDGGNRSGAGRIFVRDSDYRAAGGFLGHRLPCPVQGGRSAGATADGMRILPAARSRLFE